MVETSPRPQARPDRSKPREVPNVVQADDRNIAVDISSHQNPVSMYGQTASNNQFKVLSEDNTFGYGEGRELRGQYIPPQVGVQSGIEYMGGDIPEGFVDTADYLRSQGGRPRFNDVFLAGTGLDNPQTAAHEFMHRGVNMLRNKYDRDSVAERYGDDAAEVIYSMRLEHPLFQAMFESQGNESFNDYIGDMNMDDAEKQKVFRALKPLTEMALEALSDSGYAPPAVAGETPEEEAERKILQMERIALEDEAETFLDNLVNLFRRN